MKKINGKLLAVDIAECAIFAALMVAGAYVTIPFPLVPLTFQTVISVLAGLLLGAKKGAVSMAVYCVIGLIGVPVFAAGGGIFYVMKPSFGYILGFILSAAVAGLIAGGSGLPFWRYVVAAVAAFLAGYAVGIPYCIVCAHLLGVEDLTNLFLTGNLIYMPKDFVLCVLAGMLAKRVLPLIERGRRKAGQKTEKAE
ncbi:MAG: biotin transporter BioY [Clostridia bacterium]|nr:biotin transporter BioY [Clostridia bacterium]